MHFPNTLMVAGLGHGRVLLGTAVHPTTFASTIEKTADVLQHSACETGLSLLHVCHLRAKFVFEGSRLVTGGGKHVAAVDIVSS